MKNERDLYGYLSKNVDISLSNHKGLARYCEDVINKDGAKVDYHLINFVSQALMCPITVLGIDMNVQK